MTLDPGYGETPLPFDELDALTPAAREALEEPITKAAVYDLEQAVEAEATEQLITDVLEDRLGLDELLSDHFLRDLHQRLYGDVWIWAGTHRRHLFNLGVDPAYIALDLRTSIETIQYRWDHTEDWTPRELGVAVHAECVRIHPFTDGNGRSTRLYADLTFLAAQESEDVEMYDWSIDKKSYVALLREYDINRDPKPLAAFIPTYKL
ncbi:fido (protein-threonine AMPylation protein) [Microbacterium endophyticum]|uniref:Fido (Protein-threonine AMPylation protein) n=1 Tax=Microbacterium endophyticum TaxID=1526412 RepID=A0A7W4V3D5_9MICO|nr:Fic family protein [Microbacterium endophyticum]MBB2976141.1 fido (protein-threonine AMPylation protein) [Microbacterium endophyticum]NIK36438.1 fido (protein-threonine AMPylation protein) [Microbacterium endophyticum]